MLSSAPFPNAPRESDTALFAIPWDHSAGTILPNDGRAHATPLVGSPYLIYDPYRNMIATTCLCSWDQLAGIHYEAAHRLGEVEQLSSPYTTCETPA